MEIEKKFLVDAKWMKDIRLSACHILDIKQGYLSTDPERTVRVRIQNSSAFLTVKGKSEVQNGFDTRKEIEISIGLDEAEQMMTLCDKVLEKTRYIIPFCGYTFEVDEFKGKNYGLILAEVEINNINEAEKVELPEWIGDDVTGCPDYYNSRLV